jgi:hypothetical protein
MIQSNSQIFTDAVFGVGTDATSEELAAQDLATQEQVLGSSSFSNLATKLPRVPSNQRIAKD